ncbi:U4/U6.U5 snRNP associated protein [Scheffersomyces xylosifermentans]|uniref:U4/U6.U5 snRNP associated protein n=1 Tax=Scheffersomyces xylosifermentans TaxID=1304137 RepID=UPI00315DB91E
MGDEEKISVDQYGRRFWNVDAYAKEAKSKTKRDDSKQVNLSSSTFIKDGNSSASYLNHRENLLKESLNAVKTYNLINPSASSTSSFGNNKRFGFFCPICNLSFRDNLSLVDHINSPQHVGRANELSRKLRNKRVSAEGDQESQAETEELEGGIRRATLEEVVATIEGLVQKQIRERNQEKTGDGTSFKERVLRRQQFEEKKIAKRKERQNLKAKAKAKAKTDNESNVEEQEGSMAAMMGFSGFNSTKK